jgi:hypothetical protein
VLIQGNFLTFSPGSVFPIPYVEVHALKASLFSTVSLNMRYSHHDQWLKSPLGKRMACSLCCVLEEGMEATLLNDLCSIWRQLLLFQGQIVKNSWGFPMQKTTAKTNHRA